jgi:hypothetical protein
MPGLATYLAAGALVVLAMDLVAPPVGIGLRLASWPTVQAPAPAPAQTVNRRGKGDRLSLPVAQRRPAPVKPPSHHVLVGCEPVFSPLSVAAQLNHSGRCMAAIDLGRGKTG